LSSTFSPFSAGVGHGRRRRYYLSSVCIDSRTRVLDMGSAADRGPLDGKGAKQDLPRGIQLCQGPRGPCHHAGHQCRSDGL